MKCVRCLQDTAQKVAVAPDGSGAWEVYYCQRCNFSWRSSEEPEVIDPAKRDPWFQLDTVDIENLAALVPIPPLQK
ncbi:MAG: non-oxidative hydroxyarylic acid decarboxylases subunit D [Desulfitobacteriia bacterium]|jgi:late competence protein required for DNA uptake (superfamily II DNA/RNA helicase)